MVFLALYDKDELGLFATTRVALAFSAPAIKQIDIVSLPLQKIPPRKRQQVIREHIDKTDFVAIGVGVYTFMYSWARFAAIYGFTKNRPMLAANAAGVYCGWERELLLGPNPFSRVQWKIQGDSIQLSSLDSIFEILWKSEKIIPKQSVQYRLEGDVGLLDEIAPMYLWDPENVNRNLFKWIEKSIWLAGL